MIGRPTLIGSILLCLILPAFGRVSAQDNDLARLVELLRKRNVVVVVGVHAPAGIRRAAAELAEAAGQPLVDDACFIKTDGDRKWAFSVHNAGHAMLAVGTPTDNSVIRELFYTNARKRPEPLVTNGLTDEARVTFFEAGRLEARPWSGAPFAILAASNPTSVVDRTAALVRQFADTAVERPSLSAWFEPLSYMTFPEAVNRESERLSLALSAARNERIWVKFVVRSEVAVDSLGIRISGSGAIQGIETLMLYHLERRQGCGTRYDDVMVPLQQSDDGTVIVQQPPTKEAICFLLEYRVPETASAGQYGIDVTCRAEELTPVTLPVRLTVLDFVLPDTMPVPVYFYCSPHNAALREFFATEDEAEYEHALHSLGATFRKFGCTVCPGISYNGMVRWIMTDDGTFRIDYSPMEQFISIMKQEGLGGPYFINGRLKYPRRTRLFMSYGRAEIYDEKGTHYDLRRDRGGSGPVMPRDWKEALRQTAWLEDLQTHLERTGRLNCTYFYSGDEPSDFAQWLESVAPIVEAGLTPVTSINRITPVEDLQKLVGTLDLWILLYHPWRDARWNNVPRHELWQDFARHRRAAGDDVWWYHCLGLTTPHRSLEAARFFAWESWKYRVDGIAFWSPLAIYSVCNRVNSRSEEPVLLKDISWDELYFGGMSFYNDTKNHELLGSRRMTVVARGWEDYKVLHLLDSMLQTLPDDSPLRRQTVKVMDQAYTLAERFDFEAARHLLTQQISKLSDVQPVATPY